jgi:hypothetical protein
MSPGNESRHASLRVASVVFRDSTPDHLLDLQQGAQAMTKKLLFAAVYVLTLWAAYRISVWLR